MIRIVGTALYQWDTGRFVTTDIDADHVHFSNKGDSKAVIMDIADLQAKIPDYLLQTGKQLCVYVVRNGITVESKVFSVNLRERPENYIYEEDQRNFVYALIEDAKAATEAANQAAGAATQATQNADGSANRANAAADNANGASSNANQAAENANKAAAKAAHTAKSLMVIGETEGAAIHLDDAIDQYLVGLRVFGKTTQDGVPTPGAPVDLVSVGAGGGVGVTVTGKNLIPPTSITSGFTGNGDGTYTVADLTQNTNTIGAFRLEAGKQYTLSATRISGGGLFPCLIFRKEDGTNLKTNYVDTSLPVTVTPTETETIRIILQGTGSKGSCTVGDKFAIQLEVGFAATAYEPYKHQTLTVSTPNGLPGIPVTTGGNYTDANGQQWICDEIDFARGVYVQRCMKLSANQLIPFHYYELTNCVRVGCNLTLKSVNYANGLSTHLPLISNYNMDTQHFYSADSALWIFAPVSELTERSKEGVIAWAKALGIEFIYALETPIETPLPENELAAYASLHTYRGNTTVSNDAGAWMDLEYVMDAKKYIDSLVTGGIAPARVE